MSRYGVNCLSKIGTQTYAEHTQTYAEKISHFRDSPRKVRDSPRVSALH